MIKRILNIGVSDDQENLNNRIRLNNLVALFITIVSISFSPFYLYFHLHVLVGSSILIILVSVLSIFLQSLKKHVLGFSVLVFSTIVLLNIVSLYFGLIVNMHFFLICACMTALVLFEKNKALRNTVIGSSIISFFLLLFYFHKKPAFLAFSGEINNALEIYGYFNFFVLFAFSIIFFASFLKQKVLFQEELMNQNLILENKNHQITDSIKYAKHIQRAILPPINALKSHLKESFVFYKPKDIVAGDFYWFEKLNDGVILFAAADSTGHGVPGAMVSVVCTNSLNQAVKEFGLRDPGLILDKVRELVINCFQKSETDVKDGMDISLCAIDLNNQTLKWAGANNPLWIIRNNTDEVEVVKADKQSVAITEKPLPFTTHTVQLNTGDCFYLFTDGYADQFGGESSKKFMQKRLKELLLRIYKKPMELQKKLIHDNLLTWMGNLEQVDDICFVGIKL
jgi:serine phosphatase RsbU (regulator of sigma subunit)